MDHREPPPLQSSPWSYFLLNLALTWLFWFPAALVGRPAGAPLTMALIALGGLAPMATALILLYRTKEPAVRRDYWRRLLDVRLIPGRWYAVIALMVPVITLLGMGTAVLAGLRFPSLAHAAELLGKPLRLLPLVGFLLVFGPIPEEMGWRGYALDRLLSRHNALWASVVVGVAWTLWHLPLFFLPGTYQNQELASAAGFFSSLVSLVALSILMTWIYNHTRRSILSAVLVHFMVNFFGEFFRLPPAFGHYETAWMAVAAVVVVWVWGPQLRPRP